MTANSAMRKSHSLFDFATLAEGYDRWYSTTIGKEYDKVEKEAVLQLLPYAQPGQTLLDVGCGTGHWSRFFASLGYEVLGIDISMEMIQVARSRKPSRCRFQIADACRLPFDDACFDVVAAMTTLEFISDLPAALDEIFRCVKPGGNVIVGTLNRLAAINRRRLARREQPYASGRLFSPAELRSTLVGYGRVQILVSAHVPQQRWTRPVESLLERFSPRREQLTGAFIVAKVQPP